MAESKKPKAKKVANHQISDAYREAAVQAVKAHGGREGLRVLVDKKLKVRQVLHWAVKNGLGRWSNDLDFTGHRETLISRAYRNHLFPALQELTGFKLPLFQEEAKDYRALAHHIQNDYGVPEQALDEFDRRETGAAEGVITRGLFGSRGVYEVVRERQGEGWGYRIEWGGLNKREHLLRLDFEDKEVDEAKEFTAVVPEGERAKMAYADWHAGYVKSPALQAVLAFCDIYFEHYRGGVEDADGNWVPLPPLFGNWAVYMIFLLLGASFLSVDKLPMLCYLGKGGRGKGTCMRHLVAPFKGVARWDLVNATMTTGTEECKGPRLLAARSKLRFTRIGLILDGVKHGVLDVSFLRNLAPKGEVVECGGLYQDSIEVDMRALVIQIQNEAFRHSDSSGSTERRQFFLRAHNREFVGEGADAGEEVKTDFDIGAMTAGLEPAMRRMAAVAMEHLAVDLQLRLPEYHRLPEILRREQESAKRQTQWSLTTDFQRAFRPVRGRPGKDHEDYEFRAAKHARYAMRLGGNTAAQGVKHGRPVRLDPESKKPPQSSNGLLFIARVLMTAAGDNAGAARFQAGSVERLMSQMGYAQVPGRPLYRGIRHSQWLIEKLIDFYGNAQEVYQCLQALYAGGHAPLDEREIRAMMVDGATGTIDEQEHRAAQARAAALKGRVDAFEDEPELGDGLE